MTSLDQFGIAHDIVIKNVESHPVTPSIRSFDVKHTPSDLADEGDPPRRLTDWLFRRDASTSKNDDDIATRRSVFDDPHLASYYMPRPGYENSHRFDISARWTVREEKVCSLSYRFPHVKSH
jgi:hypothetical protein